MAEEKRLVKSPHHIILEDRHGLTVSGVEDIDSFDEATIVLFTNMGELTIKGSGLHINKLSVDTGELNVEGEVESLTYTSDDTRRRGFFSRLFQ